MFKPLGELSPLMMASFLVHTSNAATTTMIVIVIAGQPGGEQAAASLIEEQEKDRSEPDTGSPNSAWMLSHVSDFQVDPGPGGGVTANTGQFGSTRCRWSSNLFEAA